MSAPGAVRRLVPAAAGFLLPPGLLAALSFMRPDLVLPMLGEPFGRGFLAAVVVLSMLGGGVQLAVAHAPGGRRAGRVLIGVAGFLLCTLPALFLVLFGPVAFALMSAKG